MLYYMKYKGSEVKYMTFGEKLKIARTEAGLKQTELAKQLNTTGNTISNWENNVSKPDLDTLSYICGILHVNASFFLQPSLPEDEVSIKELKFIKTYRELDAHGKEIVDFILNKEHERIQQIKESDESDSESNIRYIQRYPRVASAGTGQVVFEDMPVDRIGIPDIPKYKRVSYAIEVNGNSMEPLYHDEDILLVEPTCQIDVGEIGIFIVGNEAYVKKLGEAELISLNKGYDNIPLTEDSKCMGRVVDKL